MKTVLTIGEALVEIIGTEKGDGFMEPIALVGPFPSGAPAIFIDQVARFGQPAAMVGCVGDDDFGHLTVLRLQRDGVDVSAMRVDSEAATGSAFVRYRHDGSRRFVFNIKQSASALIHMDSAARAAIDRCDHLHVVGTALFSPTLIRLIQGAIEAVKSRGGTVSFDPNLRAEMLETPGLRQACEAVFRRCDVFLPSGDELFLFTAARDIDGAVAEILSKGVSVVVHKRGVRGAAYFDAQSAIFQTGFDVAEVDPTGAGDCFGGTFVACWLRDLPPRRCLAYASASGALAVTRLGPMEGTATAAEIEAFLGKFAEVLP